MQNEKKAYETPVITLVKFDASDRITASACQPYSTNYGMLTDPDCLA